MGEKLIGVGIGIAAFIVLVMLPFLIPVTFYVIATFYAMVKGTAFSSDTVNEGVLLVLLIFSVALFPVLLAAILGWLGRALSPKRNS